MAVYKCEACGMSIGTMTGDEIQVSKGPDGHGMIKSPMCCGQDMTRLD